MYNTSTSGTTTSSSNSNDTVGGICASSAELAVTTSPTPITITLLMMGIL